MTTVLTVAVVLVGLLGLGNLLVSYGVIRRLREIDNRLSAASGHPKTGHRVSPFVAAALDGGAVTQADVATGDRLVALISPGCGSCEEVVAQIAAAPAEREPIVLVHTDEPDAAPTAEIVAAARRVGRVAVVPFGAVPEAFGVTSFPTVVLVRDGRVHASGYDMAELTAAAGAH